MIPAPGTSGGGTNDSATPTHGASNRLQRGTSAMVPLETMHRGTRIAVLVAAFVVATHASTGAQTVPRARELYGRALELDRQGDAAAALTLLWEAAGLAPADGMIQDSPARS